MAAVRNASYTDLHREWAESVLRAKVKTDGWGEHRGLCHDDQNASCTINLNEGEKGYGKIYCRSCKESWWSDEYASLFGLPEPPAKPRNNTRGESRDQKLTKQAEYIYTTAEGVPLYKVVRLGNDFGKKSFPQYRYEGGEYRKGLKGIERVLYRAQALAETNGLVLLPEGEKDVHALERFRYVATTTPQGADNVDCVKDWSLLVDRDVVIIPDNDAAGRAYALAVARKLEGLAASVGILQLPGLDNKGDFSDWVSNGGTKERFAELLESAVISPDTLFEQSWPSNPVLEAYPAPMWPGGEPKVLGDFARGVAMETQTPPDVSHLSCLADISTCVHGRFKVDPLPTWRGECLSTRFIVALETGNRKSSVNDLHTEIFHDFEERAYQRWRQEALESKTRRDVLQQQEVKLLREASNGKLGESGLVMEQLHECRRLLTEEATVVPRRLLIDDVTSEALGKAMAEQGGPASVREAEGGLFRAMAGGYGKSKRVDNLWMKSSNEERYSTNRIGREETVVKRPSLSYLVMTQNSHLVDDVLKEKVFQERGILERNIFCVPVNLLGSRDVAPPQMAPEVKARRNALIRSLLPPLDPADGTPYEVTRLAFSPDAQEVLIDFLAWLEPQLEDGARLSEIAGFASRFPSHVVRLAGLWHIVENPNQTEIDPDVVRRAITVVKEYVLPMTLRAVSLLCIDPRVKAATILLRLFRSEGWQRFSRTDLIRKKRWTPEKLDETLEFLEERGFVRVETVDSGGNKPRTDYLVNPAVFKEKSTPPQTEIKPKGVVSETKLHRNGRSSEVSI